MTQNIERKEKLSGEIENKVKKLEQESYEFGPTLTKIDFLFIIIIAIFSIMGLIWGVY